MYWKQERATGLPVVQALWLAHLYVGYSMIWYASGWRAVVRAMRGRTGWAKTDRVAEARPGRRQPHAEPPTGAGPCWR